MTDRDKNQKDRIEVICIWILGFLLATFGAGYVVLDSKKLDRAVFEENRRLIERMAGDISAIRSVIDRRAFQPLPERE